VRERRSPLQSSVFSEWLSSLVPRWTEALAAVSELRRYVMWRRVAATRTWRREAFPQGPRASTAFVVSREISVLRAKEALSSEFVST